MLLNDQPLNGLEIEDVLATLAGFLIPYVAYYIRRFVRAHVSASQVDVLQSLARIAVNAAEELAHKAAKVTETVPGSAKLDNASLNLAKLAAGVGIKLDEQQAKTIIEGVLHEQRPYMGVPDLETVLEDEEPASPLVVEADARSNLMPDPRPLPDGEDLGDLVARLRQDVEPEPGDADGTHTV